MKPKTLLGLRLCLVSLYVAIIKWPEVAARALHSPAVSLRTHTLCQAGRTVWKESPLSNKSSFWEHKAAGTLGVLLTLGAAASEIRLSYVALKPQVWRQKAGSWPTAAAQPPYLNKRRGRRAQCYHRRTTGSGRGRGGRMLRGWFRVAMFFFFCGCCFLFYLFSFVVVNSRALGKTWQQYPLGPFQSKRLLSTFTTPR